MMLTIERLIWGDRQLPFDGIEFNKHLPWIDM